MANILSDIPSKIAESFKKMNKGQKVRLFVLIAIIVAIVIVVSTFLNQKDYVTVYSGSSADAGDVMAVLDDMGVDYKTQGTGTILVEESVASSVTMELAAEGYPSSSYNTEIFEKSSGLGMTDMEKQKYWVLQTQEYIRQQILLMDKIDDALVIVDPGEDSSYVLSDDKTTPTASVTLVLKNDQSLTDSEAQTVAELVASSVSGMETANVSIADSNMRTYSTDGDSAAVSVDTQLELQNTVRDQLQTQIINLLTPVFGAENVNAEVNVLLNFDSKTTESVEFSPPADGTEGLAVSMSTLVERIASDADSSVAGIDANGTGSVYAALDDNDDDSAYYQASEEANYELNQINTMIEEAQGKIEDLSVSVILNEEMMEDDYTDEVIELVATAIGVDLERITVMSLPFAEVEDTSIQDAIDEQQDMLASMQSAANTRLMIILGTVLVVLIFLFMIIKMFKKSAEPVPVEGGFEYIADEEIIPGEEEMPMVPLNEIKLEDFEKTDNKLQILEEYVGQNPESVANLLRNWLNEE